MKAVILAGGFGSRLSEETDVRPKPLVEIGGRPIIWHIMKHYGFFGINEFIICCGYKGEMIKDYFARYYFKLADTTFDLRENTFHVSKANSEPWKVTVVDTGIDTMTGGRLKRILPYLEGDDEFCFTYGDGLSDLDIRALIKFHKAHGNLATVTAVYPPARYGTLEISRSGLVDKFEEKPKNEVGFINGGFFVLSRNVLDIIEGDETIWEEGPMKKLVDENKMFAFVHKGFWQSMDTLREKRYLEKLWYENLAPWKVYD